MFGDVSAQLFQQKAVAQLPRLFKNPKIANNQKLGRALSYSFMSATSSEEAYSIFKNAGAYCMTEGISLFLSRDLPAVVWMKKNGETQLLRQAEPVWGLNAGIQDY